jgi:glutathione S-transferase
MEEVLSWLTTELEPDLWMLDKALFIKAPSLTPDIEKYAKPQVQKAVKELERVLTTNDYISGVQFTLADVICYHLLTWSTMYLEEELSSHAQRYLLALERRPMFPTLMKSPGSPASKA